MNDIEQQYERDDENVEVLEKRCTRQRLMKIILFSILLGCIIFVLIDSFGDQHVKGLSQFFLQWVQRNPVAGIFCFIGVYFLATVLFVPGSILTLGSGFVFANAFGLGLGLLFSTIAVFVGAASGSIISFLLGRYLFRNCVINISKQYQVFEAVDSALEIQGLKIMILLRLSPLIPFNAINYILGVTSVPLRDYALACFAMLPGTILYTFLGSSAGSIVESASSGDGNTVLTTIVVIVGAVFGVLSIFATTYYAKKQLNIILGHGEENGDEE